MPVSPLLDFENVSTTPQSASLVLLRLFPHVKAVEVSGDAEAPSVQAEFPQDCTRAILHNIYPHDKRITVSNPECSSKLIDLLKICGAGLEQLSIDIVPFDTYYQHIMCDKKSSTSICDQ